MTTSRRTSTAALTQDDERQHVTGASLRAKLASDAQAAGCALSPDLAAAFASDASLQPLVLAGGLRAAILTNAAGTRRILCVANPGTRPAIFDPAAVLGIPDAGRLRFLLGQMRTHEQAGGTIACEVPAGGHVWLTISTNRGADAGGTS